MGRYALRVTQDVQMCFIMKKPNKAPQTQINKGLATRIREARVKAGFRRAKDAALAMGISPATYYSHESFEPDAGRVAKLPSLQLYARTFGVTVEWLQSGVDPSRIIKSDNNVKNLSSPTQPTGSKLPVLGVARAGHWLEVDTLSQNDEPWTVQVPTDHPAKRFAVLIRGSSMNKVLADGDVAVCVEWSAVGREPQNGDILLVERHRAGMIETTVKRYMDGQLLGESTEAVWNKPVKLGSTKGEEIVIRGLVISFQRALVPHASNTPPPYMLLEE